MHIFTKVFIINAVIFGIYMVFSVIFVLDQDLFKGYSLDGLYNDFCQRNKGSEICKNKYKKKKMVYVFIDGMAYDQMFELRKRNKYNITNIFRGTTPDYKQSALLHHEMFSGKRSRNFIGKKIEEDHIFHHFVKAGMRFSYRGIKLPVYTLLGGSNGYLEKSVIPPAEVDSLDTFCDIGMDINDRWTTYFLKEISDERGYLKPGIDKQYMYDNLDKHFSKELAILNKRGSDDIDFISQCFKNNFKWTGKESIIYYGTKVDHVNHNYDKNHVKDIIQIYLSEKLVARVIEWCWDHPEYAFFFASDHGGQSFNGLDNIINHGDNSLGNEAAFFAWSYEMAKNYDQLDLGETFVDIFDFSALVPQLIEGGAIPLESLGAPYPLANDPIFMETSVLAKVQQLLKYIELYTNKYPQHEDLLADYKYKLNKYKDEYYYSNLSGAKVTLFNLKEIQQEIEDLLNDRNKNFMFTIAFYVIFLILGTQIVFEIILLKRIIPKGRFKLILLSCILILGVFYEVLAICLYPNSVYNKLKFAIITQFFSYGFLYLIYSILYYISNNVSAQKTVITKRESLALILNIIVLMLIGVFGYIFYEYEIFIKLKRIFNKLELAKTVDFMVYYPLCFIFVSIEIYKLRNCYFDKEFKYSALLFYGIMEAVHMLCMVMFEIQLRPSFERHTLYSQTVNIFNFLFLMIIYLSSFLKFYVNPQEDSNKKDSFIIKKLKSVSRALSKENSNYVDGLIFIKLFLFEYQFYLSDEAERLLLFLFVIPLYEFLSRNFFGKNKIWKISIIVIMLGLGKEFYLLTQRYFSFDISTKVLSRTIGNYGEDMPLFSGILMGTHKLRYFLLEAGYFMSMSIFYKDRKHFFTRTSFLIRLIFYLQLNAEIIYFYYRYFNNLVGEEFLELFMWTMLHVIIFTWDALTLLLYYISNTIYMNKKGNDMFIKYEDNIEKEVNVSSSLTEIKTEGRT